MAFTSRPLSIQDWMIEHGLTQVQFAGILGITQAHLSQIINGKRLPSFRLAAKIADVTGVPLRALMPLNE